jgi:carboxyl-terminal processing protease
VGFVHPIRCLAILVLGIFLGGLPPAAQEVLPDGKHSVVPTHQKPEDWTLNPNWDSIPMLSQKGKSAGQFQLIVREIERYLGKPLDTEKVAIAYVDLFRSFQERFNSPNASDTSFPKTAGQMQMLIGMTIDLEAHQLVWIYRGTRAAIPLRKTLVNFAENSTQKALHLLANPNGKADSVFWYLWVEACLKVLDSPFNHYVYSDQIASFRAKSIGKSFGPGLIPEISGKRIRAAEVFDPVLQQAGLVSGSELVALDGQSMTSDSSALFEKWLRPAEYQYRVTFRKDDLEKTISATAIPFRHPTLSWTRYQGTVYVRLSAFARDSLIELRRLFRQLQPAPNGLIIDLRENPGGVASFGLIDCFFKPGLEIATFRDLPGGKRQSVEASMEYFDVPLALLVDHDSASMSEVFAAAVSTHKRGVIIGAKTFGKGVGQLCRSIGEEGELCLVERRYFYPGTDNTWDGEGITPDIQIEVPEDKQAIISNFLSGTILDLEKEMDADMALRQALHILAEKKK